MSIFVVFDNMQMAVEEEIQRLLPLLSQQRRERTLAYKYLLGQYCCAKSYELLVQCIQKFSIDEKDRGVDFDLSDWTGEFVFNEHGKPFLQSRKSGVSIPNVEFNISHCAKGIAVAIDNRSVGIDIERFREPSEGLLKRTMNASEINQIKSSPYPDVEFTRFWTRKEALLKLEGTGIVDNLTQALASKNEKITIHSHVNFEKRYVWSLAKNESGGKTPCV